MKTIKLTQGRFAIVDDADFELISSHKWYFDSGYATRRIKTEKSNKAFRMHQQIIGLKDNLVIDHLNGNGLDNRRNNLRFATRSENAHNRKNLKSYYWDKKKNKFICRIRLNGKTHNIGRFEKEQDAIQACNEFRIKEGLIPSERLYKATGITCPHCKKEI